MGLLERRPPITVEYQRPGAQIASAGRPVSLTAVGWLGTILGILGIAGAVVQMCFIFPWLRHARINYAALAAPSPVPIQPRVSPMQGELVGDEGLPEAQRSIAIKAICRRAQFSLEDESVLHAFLRERGKIIFPLKGQFTYEAAEACVIGRAPDHQLVSVRNPRLSSQQPWHRIRAPRDLDSTFELVVDLTTGRLELGDHVANFTSKNRSDFRLYYASNEGGAFIDEKGTWRLPVAEIDRTILRHKQELRSFAPMQLAVYVDVARKAVMPADSLRTGWNQRENSSRRTTLQIMLDDGHRWWIDRGGRALVDPTPDIDPETFQRRPPVPYSGDPGGLWRWQIYTILMICVGGIGMGCWMVYSGHLILEDSPRARNVAAAYAKTALVWALFNSILSMAWTKHVFEQVHARPPTWQQAFVYAVVGFAVASIVPLSYLHTINGEEEKAYLDDLAKARSV